MLSVPITGGSFVLALVVIAVFIVLWIEFRGEKFSDRIMLTKTVPHVDVKSKIAKLRPSEGTLAKLRLQRSRKA